MVAGPHRRVAGLLRGALPPLPAGRAVRAGRPCRVEVGFLWLLRGEETVGSGWVSRAVRLLEEVPECAEHGYLLYLRAEEQLGRGDHEAAAVSGRTMQQLAARHDDPTLGAIGLVVEGTALVRRGRLDEGLAVLDEAMLGVRAGEVQPTWTGNLYCHLMSLFIELGDIPRARAWTDATERWCDEHSNPAMFVGICRVHRAQLLHLEGAWPAAERSAAQACRDLADMNVEVVAEGHYELGELRRLQGDDDGAEEAYARARRLGRDPQPGMALLRLAQGRTRAAATALRTALLVTTEAPRARPAAGCTGGGADTAGDAELAAAAAGELATIADVYATPGLLAAARQASGVARLVGGEPERALPLLRDAWRRWRELDAPCDAARVRVLLARALMALEDADGAASELDAARETLVELGAVGELWCLEGAGGPARAPEGLTAARSRCSRRGPRRHQSRDRRRAHDQRAHGRAAPVEHLHQARRRLADRGGRLRVRAPPRRPRGSLNARAGGRG
jgi:tetratricopeptide (TPR) repeat protein